MKLKSKKREPQIFSGKDSKELWKRINALHDHMPDVFWALYIMGCRCQELEAIVRRLEKLKDNQ